MAFSFIAVDFLYDFSVRARYLLRELYGREKQLHVLVLG